MSVTATRSVTIVYSGDVVGTQTHDAADNTVSPGISYLMTLDPGTTEFPLDFGGSTVATAVTIIPAFDNEVLITLKGDPGDVGVALNLTAPSSFGVDPSVVSLFFTVAELVSIRILVS